MSVYLHLCIRRISSTSWHRERERVCRVGIAAACARVPREGGFRVLPGEGGWGARLGWIHIRRERALCLRSSLPLSLSLSRSFSISLPLLFPIASVTLALGWRGLLSDKASSRAPAPPVGGPRVVARDSACRGGMLSSQPGIETARRGAQHAPAGRRRLAGRGTSPAAVGRRRGLAARQAGPARAGAPAQRVAGVHSCLGSGGLAALPVIASIHSEPGNALSLPTWAIHVSSVVEWVTAQVLFWRYAEITGKHPCQCRLDDLKHACRHSLLMCRGPAAEAPKCTSCRSLQSACQRLLCLNLCCHAPGEQRWKGMTWGMMPLLGGALAACVYHFFYNSPQLDVLVVIQAALTVVGNFTCWWAAYRLYQTTA